jgi:peptidoglycan hydrolase CwlO-like protein
MKVTIKQLQDTIKAKDLLIKDYQTWIDVLATYVNRKNKTIKTQTARIKVLGKALAALEKDYDALKRKRK